MKLTILNNRYLIIKWIQQFFPYFFMGRMPNNKSQKDCTINYETITAFCHLKESFIHRFFLDIVSCYKNSSYILSKYIWWTVICYFCLDVITYYFFDFCHCLIFIEVRIYSYAKSLSHQLRLGALFLFFQSIPLSVIIPRLIGLSWGQALFWNYWNQIVCSNFHLWKN